MFSEIVKKFRINLLLNISNIIGRLGIKMSTKDTHGMYVYSKWELNVPKTLGAVVCLCYAWPYIIELLAGLIATGGWQLLFP